MKIFTQTIVNQEKKVFQRVINGTVVSTSIPLEDAPMWEKELQNMNDKAFYKLCTGRVLKLFGLLKI